MAEKVEIDIPGIGLIEAKNAATEATLLEILNVLQNTQKDLKKYNTVQTKSPSGGGPGAGAGGAAAAAAALAASAAGMGASLGLAGKAAGAFGKGLGLAGKGIGMAAGITVGALTMAVKAATALASGLVNLGHTAIGLADAFANMQDSVSGAAGAVANALGKLPGILGQVGGLVGAVFTAVAGAAERLVGAYQNAASVGATFGGNLNEMASSASAAGMTLDKFAGLISKNGEAMTYLGGTTESGARRFAQLSKEMRNSNIGNELLRMGYSTEQVNSGMAAYIGIMGKTGALQNMTTQQIARSSAGYLKDLDALAKITGQTREEKQKEQEALMKDAQFRAAVAGMDAESQKQMMNYITSFPKEQQAAIKDMIATGTATTEESVKLAALMPGLANQAQAFGRTLQSGGKVTQEQMNRSRDAAIQEAKNNTQRYKTQGLYNKEMGETYVGMADLASKTAGDWAKAQKEGTEATKKANQAEQIEKFKQRIAEISNSFTTLLANSGILNVLMKAFEGLVSIVSTFVIPAVNGLFAAIQKVVPPIIDTLVPIIVSLGQAMFELIGKVVNNFGPIFTDTILPVLSSIASAFVTLLNPAIEGVTNIFKGLDQTTGGLGATIQSIVDGALPVFNGLIRGASMLFEGLVRGVGYLIKPIMNLGSSILNLFGGTEGLTSIFLHVGNIVGTAFEYIGVVGGIVADTLSFLVEVISQTIDTIFGFFNVIGKVLSVFGDLAMKSDFLRAMVEAVGKGFDYLKMVFSPAGIQSIFTGLKMAVGTITDFILDFKDGFKGLLAELLIYAGKLIPGLSKVGEGMKEEIAEDKKARDEAAKQRKAEFERTKQVAQDEHKRRTDRVDKEKTAIAQDQKGHEDRKKHMQSMGALNKQAEDAKKAEAEAAKGPQEVDMTSPMAMLESFSRQQGGFFADRIDQGRKEQAIAKEKKSIEEEAARVHKAVSEAKTEEEKKAAQAQVDALKERMKKFEEMISGAKPTGAPGAAPAPSVAPTKLPAGSQVTGLGAVAAHFEAGGKAGTVSTGHGDFGGKSYGAFQLSSKTGDVQKFLEKSGYAKQFEGMAVGSAEFDKKWKELGETKEFAQAQATHAKSTHYDPQMQKLSKAGLDMSGRGAGVQEAIMSTANQYGANTDLIMKALKDKDTSKMSDKDIINAIQDYKADTVKTRFKSSSAAVQAGVAKRIEQERAMLLGVDGGATQADVRKAEQSKPSEGKPPESKPPESKPGKEPTLKIDPKLANDWAYSIFVGKNSMSQVPKPYLDEVGKILAKPPANWAAAPKTPEAKVEGAKTEAAKPPEQKPVEEVKVKPEEASIKNWAYAVFEGKASLGQVPMMYRDKVAEFLKSPPADWVKAPPAGKPAAVPTAQEMKDINADMQELAAKTPTNEEFKINGKQVSKEEFDAYMKANPQAAQMMDMAKNMAAGKGLPGSDMMQKMGSMLPIGSDAPGLTDKILGPNVDPNELFKSQLANLGEGAASYELNGKSVTKEEFDKAIQDNPALKSLMSAAGDPMASLQNQLGNFGADASSQVESILGPTSALTNVDSLKNTMAEDAATRMAQEAEQRKMMFQTMGRTDVQTTATDRSNRRGGATGTQQENASDTMALLNTKLEQLISINQNIANVNNDQLRVQRKFSTSGDVYDAPGS